MVLGLKPTSLAISLSFLSSFKHSSIFNLLSIVNLEYFVLLSLINFNLLTMNKNDNKTNPCIDIILLKSYVYVKRKYK